jgi:hypothetical protein
VHAESTANSNQTIDSVNLKSENPKDYEASLVHSPQKASNEEGAWIEYIGAMVAELFRGDAVQGGQQHQPSTPGAAPPAVANGHTVNGVNAETTTPDTGPSPAEMWPILLKYFDGRYALEEISARENLKKKKIREFWSRLVKEGLLVTVRHW